MQGGSRPDARRLLFFFLIPPRCLQPPSGRTDGRLRAPWPRGASCGELRICMETQKKRGKKKCVHGWAPSQQLRTRSGVLGTHPHSWVPPTLWAHSHPWVPRDPRSLALSTRGLSRSAMLGGKWKNKREKDGGCPPCCDPSPLVPWHHYKGRKRRGRRLAEEHKMVLHPPKPFRNPSSPPPLLQLRSVGSSR